MNDKPRRTHRRPIPLDCLNKKSLAIARLSTFQPLKLRLYRLIESDTEPYGLLGDYLDCRKTGNVFNFPVSEIQIRVG